MGTTCSLSDSELKTYNSVVVKEEHGQIRTEIIMLPESLSKKGITISTRGCEWKLRTLMKALQVFEVSFIIWLLLPLKISL
jgi:hypothetical protein